eukprot:m.49696 g.49696  ORF g.49696 m.49696 type:complete len:284 (+) comp10624_c0_seq3:131-982(+)
MESTSDGGGLRLDTDHFLHEARRDAEISANGRRVSEGSDSMDPSLPAKKKKKARRAPRKNRGQRSQGQQQQQHQQQNQLPPRTSSPKQQIQVRGSPTQGTLSPMVEDNKQNPIQNQKPASGGGTRRGKRRRIGQRPREQPPPAPRNTTQFIAGTDRDRQFQNPTDEEYYSEDVLERSTNAAEDDFMEAYNDTMYNEMMSWTPEKLIQRIRDRDRDVDNLHSQNNELQGINQQLVEQVESLEMEIENLKKFGARQVKASREFAGPVSVEVLEEAEADEFARADF